MEKRKKKVRVVIIGLPLWIFSIFGEQTSFRIRYYYVKKKEAGKYDATKSKLVFFVYPGLNKFRVF